MKQRFLDEPEQIDMEMGGNEGQGNANNGSGNGGNGEEELSQYYRPYDNHDQLLGGSIFH